MVNVARPVARVVASLFLDDETLVLADPRIKSPSRYK
jgi:hypothetical protein